MSPGFKHAGLVIVFLAARQGVVAEDVGGNPDVFGVMDGNAGGRAVPEQVRRDGRSECFFRMQLDLPANGIAVDVVSEPGDPKVVRDVADKQARAVMV